MTQYTRCWSDQVLKV